LAGWGPRAFALVVTSAQAQVSYYRISQSSFMANHRNYKGSLRLDWINKDLSLYYEIDEKEGKGVRPVWVPKNDIRVAEPRILKFVKNYGDPTNENMLIKGDNLLVLRSLAEMFKGKAEKDKVKCIYIDPPYNTGNAFEKYDDNLQHSEWLTMMRDRLILLKKLLRKDGIICVQIDDTESHYLKLLMDEIYGRDNYFCVIYIQTVYPEKTLKQDRVFHDLIEQIFVYKNSPSVKVNQETLEYNFGKFCYYIKEHKNATKTTELGGKKVEIFTKDSYSIEVGKPSDKGLKEIWASGTILDINSSGRFFRDYISGRVKEDGLGVLYKVYGIGEDNYDFRYFTGPQRANATKGKYYQGVPKKILNDKNNIISNKSIENYWNMAADFGNCSHEGGVELKSGKKPEVLIMRLLKYFSKKNDVVLDSFLGSGTTAAVACKMKRRWIGIEIGRHAETHCLKRLKYVTDKKNPDQTGISKLEEINWKGEGGFRYYQLGESLIHEKDMNWALKAEEMAEAIFLHFQYNPTKAEWLEKQNMYLGRHQSARYNFALSFAIRDTKVLTEELYDKIIVGLDKEKFKHLTIFTNVALAVPPESLDDRVLVKKIPAAILREYNLI
jgi:adenine-specific DNA-methyltransferase